MTALQQVVAEPGEIIGMEVPSMQGAEKIVEVHVVVRYLRNTRDHDRSQAYLVEDATRGVFHVAVPMAKRDAQLYSVRRYDYPLKDQAGRQKALEQAFVGGSAYVPVS